MTLKQRPYRDREGRLKKTRKWYADFYDHRGIRRALALFPDKKNSEEAKRAVEHLIGIRASGAMVPPELHRFIENTTPAIRQKLAAWGIIDAARVAVVTPLRKQIEEWGRWLLNKGTSEAHVDLITSRVTNLFAACGFRFWSDISAERANEQLAIWRARAERPLAAQTSNFYRQNARQFCKWMVERGHAPASPLVSLAASNVAADRRHDRRAFSLEEFNWLLGYLEQGPTVMKLSAAERALLYRFAAMTGLRRGAIAKLKGASFDLFGDPPHVYIPAGAGNKYRRAREVPLDAELAALLKQAVQGRPAAELAFKMPPKGHTAKMIRADVDAARSAWIADAPTPDEQRQREQSSFLRYCDDRNRHLDFHALRHTRGVWLFKYHGAKPREVQDLMGLGSLALVDRYTASFEVADPALVNRGPRLIASDVARAGSSPSSGTNGKPSVLPHGLLQKVGSRSIPEAPMDSRPRQMTKQTPTKTTRKPLKNKAF